MCGRADSLCCHIAPRLSASPGQRVAAVNNYKSKTTSVVGVIQLHFKLNNWKIDKKRQLQLVNRTMTNQIAVTHNYTFSYLTFFNFIFVSLHTFFSCTDLARADESLIQCWLGLIFPPSLKLQRPTTWLPVELSAEWAILQPATTTIWKLLRNIKMFSWVPRVLNVS